MPAPTPPLVDCRSIALDACAYANDQLDAAMHDAIAAHALACAPCADAIACGARYLSAMRRAARATPAPSSLHARVALLIA